MQYAQFKELVRKYLVNYENSGNRPASIVNRQKEFRITLRCFQRKEFNVDTVREHLETRRREGRALVSLNEDIKRFRALIHWGLEEKLIPLEEDFRSRIKPYKVHRRESIPGWEPIKKLVDYLENKRPESPFSKVPEDEVKNEYIPAIRLMMYTGIRSGAFRTLKGKDIAVNESRPTLYFENKGGDMKDIPIPPQCMEDMTRRAGRGDDYAFAFSNRERYQDKISSLVKEGAKAVGIDPSSIRPHTLRHAYITHMLNFPRPYGRGVS